MSVSMNQSETFTGGETVLPITLPQARQRGEDFFVYLAPLERQPVAQEIHKGGTSLLHIAENLLEGYLIGQFANTVSQARMFPPKGMKLCQALHHPFAVLLSRGQRPLGLEMRLRHILEQHMPLPGLR